MNAAIFYTTKPVSERLVDVVCKADLPRLIEFKSIISKFFTGFGAPLLSITTYDIFGLRFSAFGPLTTQFKTVYIITIQLDKYQYKYTIVHNYLQ